VDSHVPESRDSEIMLSESGFVLQN